MNASERKCCAAGFLIRTFADRLMGLRGRATFTSQELDSIRHFFRRQRVVNQHETPNRFADRE